MLVRMVEGRKRIEDEDGERGGETRSVLINRKNRDFSYFIYVVVIISI